MANKYSLIELEQASDVPVRTLRDWIRKKVLPSPLGGGRGAHYSEQHAAAARVIRGLRKTGMHLDAIRARVVGRSEEELRALLQDTPSAQVEASSVVVSSANVKAADVAYPVQTLEVVALADGLTLLVNAERGAHVRTMAEDIYRRYGGRSGGE